MTYIDTQQESVIEYHSAGLHPIPLHPKSKRPKGLEWQKQERQPTAYDQKNIFGPSDNVGVICGDEILGRYHICADLDKFREGMHELLEDINFWVVKSGRANGEGRHFHFLCDKKIKSRDIFFEGEQVGELKASGQVVSPPSIHEVSGLPYEALRGSCEDMPLLSAEQIDLLFPAKESKPFEKASYEPLTEPEKLKNAVEKVFVYASRKIAGAEYGQRHNVICKYAYWIGGFVGGGDIDRVEAERSLKMWVLALFEDAEEGQKEFKTIKDALDAGAKKPIRISESKDSLPEMSPEEWSKFAVSLGLEKPEIEVDEEFESDRDEIPENLQKCFGPVGDLAKYMTETGIRPQPYLAVGASLALFGTLLGQRVRTTQDARTNLMIVGVSGTASGKEHARLVMRKLLHKADLSHHNPGDEVTGGTAIERVMGSADVADSRCLFLFDEWGDMCKEILAKGSPSHQTAVIRTIMKFYSQANGIYLPKEFSKKEDTIQPIEQPTLCIYATTTPEAYFGAMKSTQILNGFLNRFIHLITPDERPKEQLGTIIDPPEELIGHLKRVADLPHNNSTGIGGRYNPDLIVPKELPFSADGQGVIREFSAYCDEQVDSGSEFAPLWGRASQMSQQVALILAGVSQLNDITAKEALFGVEFVETAMKRTINAVGDQLADNEQEHLTKRVLRIINDEKTDGIDKSALTRKTQFLKKPDRDGILYTLIESKQIVFKEMKMTSKSFMTHLYYGSKYCG